VHEKLVACLLMADPFGLAGRSPLLVLPLVAMFVFIAIWVVAAVRVMTRSSTDLEEAARLPLLDGTSGPHLGDDDDR
jgi:hypothetical protein